MGHLHLVDSEALRRGQPEGMRILTTEGQCAMIILSKVRSDFINAMYLYSHCCVSGSLCAEL